MEGDETMTTRAKRIGALAYEAFGLWLLALLIAGGLYALLGWFVGHTNDLLLPAVLVAGGFLARAIYHWCQADARGGW